MRAKTKHGEKSTRMKRKKKLFVGGVFNLFAFCSVDTFLADADELEFEWLFFRTPHTPSTSVVWTHRTSESDKQYETSFN